MIDLGLSKLALIGVVALVVLGPERLPKVARMAGTLLGRAQRYINSVKSEVSREMELEELRKVQKEFQDSANSFEESVAKNVSEVESDLNSTFNDAVYDHASSTLTEPPTSESLTVKVKDFRRKKLARTSAVPSWYKRQNGQKTRVISGAARVAKHRPAGVARKSSASFY